MTRHAWLQKHPSPRATGGEFHWYPESGDRELRSSLVERVRGVEPPAVLWQIERGRVAWAQVFSATAPLDGRRYVGLVLSVIEGERVAAELLAMLAPPRPAPWSEGAATEVADCDPGIQAALTRTARGDVAGVLRALLSGGTATITDPSDGALPLWIASIARLVPGCGEQVRSGVWATSAARGERDRVAELGAAAWREPGSRASAAWTLLCELARGASLDRVGAALEAIDASSVLTADERAELANGRSVVEVLHAWGRGRFDRSGDRDTLPARLAELIALRVLVRLAAGDDAGGAIAEARWHALLPATRRTALLAAVARRSASLRDLVEAVDA
jgi:hypothetical protein